MTEVLTPRMNNDLQSKYVSDFDPNTIPLTPEIDITVRGKIVDRDSVIRRSNDKESDIIYPSPHTTSIDKLTNRKYKSNIGKIEQPTIRKISLSPKPDDTKPVINRIDEVNPLQKPNETLSQQPNIEISHKPNIQLHRDPVPEQRQIPDLRVNIDKTPLPKTDFKTLYDLKSIPEYKPQIPKSPLDNIPIQQHREHVQQNREQFDAQLYQQNRPVQYNNYVRSNEMFDKYQAENATISRINHSLQTQKETEKHDAYLDSTRRALNLEDIPNYASMTPEMRSYHRGELNTKLIFLSKECGLKFSMDKFDNMSLEEVYHYFVAADKQVRINSNVVKYRGYLSTLWIVIEVVLSYFGFNVEGYSTLQMGLPNLYDGILMDLAEQSYLQQISQNAKEKWDPNVSLVISVVVGIVIFYAVNFLSTFMGKENAKYIVDKFVTFITNISNSVDNTEIDMQSMTGYLNTILKTVGSNLVQNKTNNQPVKTNKSTPSYDDQ